MLLQQQIEQPTRPRFRVAVDEAHAAVEQALAGGFTLLQSASGFGAEGDGAFAYFMPPGVPMIVELISAPSVRIEPEFVYPADPG